MYMYCNFQRLLSISFRNLGHGLCRIAVVYTVIYLAFWKCGLLAQQFWAQIQRKCDLSLECMLRGTESLYMTIQGKSLIMQSDG